MKAKKSRRISSETEAADGLPGRNYFDANLALRKEKRDLLESIKPPAQMPSRYDDPRAANEYFLHCLTFKYLDSTLDFEPTKNFDWRDHAAKAGDHYARRGLDQLTQLVATGDTKAIAALADIAANATQTLNDLSRRAPEQVRPVARQRFFWPFLHARKPRFDDDHKRLVKEIELGYDAPFNKAAVARVRADNVAVKTAMTLLCRLESYRHRNPAIEHLLSAPLPLVEWKVKAMRLEPFSNDTWPDWFEVAWQALLAEHKGHPERDSELRDIGWYRRKHSYDQAAQQRTTPRTRETNIKDGIREQLRKAAKRLAAFPHKPSQK